MTTKSEAPPNYRESEIARAQIQENGFGEGAKPGTRGRVRSPGKKLFRRDVKRPVFAALAAMSIIAAGGLRAGHGKVEDMKSGYAPVNGLRMYCEIHGVADGKNPPLVLMHGGGSTIETSFGSVLAEFAKHRQVIAFEQQGHERTADADRPFSFEQSADDAAALMDYLKIAKADFLGYSNGGTIALQMGMRHPRVVRKLVVLSAMFKRDGMYPEFWESMKHATLETMPAELREAYLGVAPETNNLQSFFDKSVQRMVTFKDWPDSSIKSINAPTLVMVGDADVVRPEHAVETFRLLPHGQLAVLPLTDHMMIVKRAEWQVSMVETFLDSPMPK